MACNIRKAKAYGYPPPLSPWGDAQGLSPITLSVDSLLSGLLLGRKIVILGDIKLLVKEPFVLLELNLLAPC